MRECAAILICWSQFDASGTLALGVLATKARSGIHWLLNFAADAERAGELRPFPGLPAMKQKHDLYLQAVAVTMNGGIILEQFESICDILETASGLRLPHAASRSDCRIPVGSRSARQ